ncbi:MAG: peptidylprolyl isomerase [Clostridiales bacterium]|nr:peptidylprolyl isomerase [Clostridiales bacterium]
MKTMKRLLACLLVLAMCCALSACKKDETPTATATDAPAAPTGNPDDVMITVGNDTVTRAAYEECMNTLVNFYANYGYDTSDAQMMTMLQEVALRTALEYAVMDQKIAELGLALTEDEKNAAIADAKTQWESTIADGLAYYGITEESTEEERNNTTLQVLAELEGMGYTAESYEAEAVKNAAYDKLYDVVTKDVTVSDEDVKAYYDNLVETDKEKFEGNVPAYEQAQYMNTLYAMYGMADYITELYYKPAGYRLVTHILLEVDEELLNAYTDLQATYEEQQNTIEEGGEVTETLVTAEEIENARLAILNSVQPKVDEINQKLSEGKTFAELIPEYTSDPGMQDEAAIAKGYEVHMDSTNWVVPFRDQAFTVNEIGAVTAPVVTDYGVHIIQYVADVPSGPVELTDELRASFQATLLDNSQKAAFYAAIDEWLAAVTPVYSAEAQAILDAAAAQAQEETAE